jgi:hypothetical protein
VEHCEQCGFTYDEAKITEVATLLHGEQIARVRTAPGVWSALEYSCHVRDVLLGQMTVATDLAVKVFERLSEEQARRPYIYNYPAPTVRNVGWLALHTVHEAKHHVGDVRSVLAQVNSPR